MIQGKAGTGKSFLIKKIISKISDRLGKQAVKVLAPNGVAATNIGGSTYHSFLKIQRQFKNLENAALRSFQLQMEGTKFLIFDEVSMIGLKAFHYIQIRCKEATAINEPFGGLFGYFLGDLKQLPPVKDTPVYFSKIMNSEAALGKLAFSSLQQTFKLSTCIRQSGDDHSALGTYLTI